MPGDKHRGKARILVEKTRERVTLFFARPRRHTPGVGAATKIFATGDTATPPQGNERPTDIKVDARAIHSPVGLRLLEHGQKFRARGFNIEAPATAYLLPVPVQATAALFLPCGAGSLVALAHPYAPWGSRS